jgi:hypothetical protein
MSLRDKVEWLFPFESMQVGDSFFIPSIKTSPLIYSIERGAKRSGIRVKTQIVIEDDLMGVRTWRVD